MRVGQAGDYSFRTIMLTTRFVFLGFALLSAKSASSEPYLGECCPMGKIYFESSELFCTFGSKREVHLLYPNNTDAGIDRGFLLECFKLEDIVITTLDDYVPDEQVSSTRHARQIDLSLLPFSTMTPKPRSFRVKCQMSSVIKHTPLIRTRGVI